jgi:signal transduction histidine kinase
MTHMPLREWLRPPQIPLLALFLLTLASASSLGWFGWRLLQQDQAVEAQRAQERLEQSADRIAERMRGAVTATQERLTLWSTNPARADLPPQGLLLVSQGNTFSAFPRGRLLYWPSSPLQFEARPYEFADGERLEFVKEQLPQAAESYRSLARAGSRASLEVRAGALLRLARVLRKSSKKRESVAVYEQLASLPEARVAGAPADLVARLEICALHGPGETTQRLKQDLLQGKWHLSRGQFEFYWSEAEGLSGEDEAAPADQVALADAAPAVWKETSGETAPRGERTRWTDGKPFLAFWRNEGGRRLLFLTRADAWLRSAAAADEVASASLWAVADSDGRILAGRKDGPGRAAIRTAAETQLPWNLYVTRLPSDSDPGLPSQRRFVLLSGTIMILFLVACTYFIARAIRREAEVARLQASFVSAVSHEFRSPLTSMRQLSEVLAEGRVPSEGRRQMYYETLVSETGRLQRLVETLLDFGKMEAGARRFRFESLEAGDLARQVSAEFLPQIVGSGRHIELQGPAQGCAIQGDPEALSLALRNLVDNALKYSPNCPVVWVEWAQENGFVAMRVRDHGAGIARSEKRAIFRKFVRGSAAAAGGVKGTGVGLTMVRQIVLAHKGHIRLASEPGCGSTFTLLLPARKRS